MLKGTTDDAETIEHPHQTQNENANKCDENQLQELCE